MLLREIKGYDGTYFISDCGTVVSMKYGKRRVLKHDVVNGGYLRVTLSKNNISKRYMVHRLVAEYFITNVHNYCHVNHIDGDKKNNNVLNLEWCNPSQNEIHSYRVLGKINCNRKLTNDQVSEIRDRHKNGQIIVSVVAAQYNVNVKTIYNIINRKFYV